jgi:signal transduction histidine kinase
VGLGLAFSRWAVEAHHGRIYGSERPRRRMRFYRRPPTGPGSRCRAPVILVALNRTRRSVCFAL